MLLLQTMPTSTTSLKIFPNQKLTPLNCFPLEQTKEGLEQDQFSDGASCSMYERDSVISSPMQITQPLNGSFSLFSHPITIQTSRLFQNACTAKVTEQALTVIDPNFFQKTDQELATKKLSVVQQFALDNLLEHLLRRCDTIINNPAHNFCQLQTVNNSHAEIIALKPFKNFTNNSIESLFLKHYKFLTKIQNRNCCLPPKFNSQKYLETNELDHFFEDELKNPKKDGLQKIRCPRKIHLRETIINLALLADTLQQNLALKDKAPNLKRCRIEP